MTFLTDSFVIFKWHVRSVSRRKNG